MPEQSANVTQDLQGWSNFVEYLIGRNQELQPPFSNPFGLERSLLLLVPSWTIHSLSLQIYEPQLALFVSSDVMNGVESPAQFLT